MFFMIRYLENIILNYKFLIYFFVFLIAFLESLFIIGLFLPSSVIMFFIGFLIGKKYMNLYISYLVSCLGCLLGDVISYYLGKCSKNYSFYVDKIFLKYSYVINKVFCLFKSNIFITFLFGRFLGFIRPFILFLSGMLLIPVRKILVPEILGVAIWPLFYFVPGVFAGIVANIPNSKIFCFHLFSFILLIIFSVYLLYYWYMYHDILHKKKILIFDINLNGIKSLLALFFVLEVYLFYQLIHNISFSIFVKMFYSMFS